LIKIRPKWLKLVGLRSEPIAIMSRGSESRWQVFFAGLAAAGADVQYILTGIHSGNLPGARVLSPDIAAHVDNLEHCAKEDQEAIKRMAFIAAKADNKDEAQQGRKKRA